MVLNSCLQSSYGANAALRIVSFVLFSSVSLASWADSGRADYDLDNDGLIEINDLADLNDIRNHLEGTALYGSSAGCPISGCTGFELVNDLDFDTNADSIMDALDTYWNSGEGWAPIGDDSGNSFTAMFNGNGYSISNLFIDRNTTDSVALFSVLDGAVVNDLEFDGELTSVTGNHNVAILAGQVDTGGVTISGCHISASVTGERSVGTLVGNLDNGSIEGCEVSATVAGNTYNIGGLVGVSDASGEGLVILGSHFTGSVEGNFYVGGFIGQSGEISIANSYVNATVTAVNDTVGGLIGQWLPFNEVGSTIRNSYALGSVSGAAYIGGFIGLAIGNPGYSLDISDSYSGNSLSGGEYVAGMVAGAQTDMTLERVFAFGAISGTNDLAGLIADGDSAITTTDAYWDTDATGQLSTFNDSGLGLTTAELQCPSELGDAACSPQVYDSWSTDTWVFSDTNEYPDLILDNSINQDSLNQDSDNAASSSSSGGAFDIWSLLIFLFFFHKKYFLKVEKHL